ncbi:MAG: hypothetical protein J7L96_04725 [Bacteroidales bacterium]|nr:hypothetical protein [Bacteroidales bacterium]
MNANTKSRVLVSPLEWGLGHATRLSRLIQILLNQGIEVIIAADGLPYNFLSTRFPDLTIIRLPFTTISYSASRRGFFTKLLFQIPGILMAIHRTRKQVQHLVSDYKIDYIISDNRYGFYHPQIPSVFISHQLRPQPPKALGWVENIFCSYHLRMLRYFDYWWIPDYEGADNVCGRLSHLPWDKPKIRYIDPVSWLDQEWPAAGDENSAFDLLFLLSGPEPQRSRLEEKALSILGKTHFKSLILQGLPHPAGEKTVTKQIANCTLVNHLPGDQISYYLKTAKTIICRAGVVTVFDLAALGLPALLIPTEGQTEQEYVARHLYKNGYFDYCEEKDLSLKRIEAFKEKAFKTFPKPNKNRITQALKELKEL